MELRFVIKWMYFGNIFIGMGIVIGPTHKGIVIGNLFIGFERQ